MKSLLICTSRPTNLFLPSNVLSCLKANPGTKIFKYFLVEANLKNLLLRMGLGMSCVAILCFCCVEMIVVLNKINDGYTINHSVTENSISLCYSGVLRHFFTMFVYTSVFFQIIGVLSIPTFMLNLPLSNHNGGKNKQKTDTKMPLFIQKVAFLSTKTAKNRRKSLCINILYKCIKKLYSFKIRRLKCGNLVQHTRPRFYENSRRSSESSVSSQLCKE